MRLIRSVEIQRFRSCEATKLTDLDDMVVIVGPNNSGKSNVLRALNLFFNEETDPNQFLDFGTDFRLRPPTSKKKKSIRVCVEFHLPDTFHFPEKLEPTRQLLGQRFWVAKEWTPYPDPFEPSFQISSDGNTFRPADAEQAAKVNRFLNLISFRYVPNRAVPAEIIREHSRDVLKYLARRLPKGRAGGRPQLFEDLSRVAKELARPIAADLTQACVGIDDLELATPAKVIDVLAEAGFKSAIGAVGKVDDTALGASVQSLLMFHVLYVIDRGQFERSFGWRQAAVWAIEEPESSLHRQLQVWLATLLRRFAGEDGSKFQIVATTHNDVFVYAASTAYTAVLDDSRATVVELKPIGEVASWATDYGVAGWAPTVLKFPTNTVVLVEGDHDRTVLRRAAQLTDVATDVIFATPSDLDPTLGGDGWEQQKDIITKYASYMHHRLPAYPLKVLLDWDRNNDQLRQVRTKYGTGADDNVARMDPQHAGRLVGESFKGIERFYTDRLLRLAEGRGILPLLTGSDGVIEVRKPQLDQAKAALAQTFGEEAEKADCQHVLPVLRWASGV